MSVRMTRSSSVVRVSPEGSNNLSWGPKGPNPGQLRASRLLAGDQRHTCLVGGARSGKTTTLVRAIILRALRYPRSRHMILRLRAVHADASIAMDTLPKVNAMCFPGLRYRHVKHPHNYIRIGDNSEIWIGGLDDKQRVDKILGNEYSSIFLNECSEISYSSVLTVKTRLAQTIPGLRQRMYYDLNPTGKSHWTNKLFGEKRDPLTNQPLTDPQNYERLFLNPSDNVANLTEEYLRDLDSGPETHRKRFFLGEYVDEFENALWSFELLDQMRRTEADIPEERRERIVIGVDPSGVRAADDFRRDEVGIVVACKSADGDAYVLADLSMRGKPEQWGRAVVEAYHKYRADRVVAEVNFGGDMVRATIQVCDPNVPVEIVTASRGKWVRAEPVSTLYTKGRVHHVGRLPKLEEQLCGFTGAGYRGADPSPDRADAAIWAITDLMVEEMEGWGVYQHYKQQSAGIHMTAAAAAAAATVKPEFGFSLSSAKRQPQDQMVTLRAPRDISQVYGISGRVYLVAAGRNVTVTADDAKYLYAQGFTEAPALEAFGS